MQAEQDTVIAIPTLDEADHVGAVLDGLLADGGTAPIWVIDGGSRDGTRTIVRRYAAAHPRIALVDNPDRTQAAAMNLAARRGAAQGASVLIRLDAHARYPAGYAGRLRARLDDTGADSVTVLRIARGTGLWQTAAARLQRSWLGHGGARHRVAGRGGWVDHGHHAAFRIDRFLALGGYDPRFVANEDAEYDLRLTAAGGRIWLEPSLPVAYLPRRTPGALWRQMRRNGRWRIETALKHGRVPGLRQLLPVLATLGLGGSASTGLFLHPAGYLPALGYLGLVFALAFHAGGPRLGAVVALLAVISHLGFGLGALGRLVTATLPSAPGALARRPAQ